MPQPGVGTLESVRSGGRVHVLGAGPVGLMLTALLQPLDGVSVRLYEKRGDYTRTRMVRLAPYLVADSAEGYSADSFDGDNVAAVFEPPELAEGLAFRQSIPSDLMTLLREWELGFCPLNQIERSISDLIDSRGTTSVERTAGAVTAEEAIAMLEPGDVVIDCTGSRSLLRDHLVPGSGDEDGGANTFNFLFEHALVITFLYGQTYACNEYCKYYKNVENAHYKFIPMVHRVFYDGSVSHVTGIVSITPEEYEAMPKQFDGEWLRGNFPSVAAVDGPLHRQDQAGDEWRARRRPRDHPDTPEPLPGSQCDQPAVGHGGPSDHPFTTAPVLLLGDSAIGSPYFQSISLGFECAMFLAGLISQPHLPLTDMLDRYELYIYKQWLRVYMQSKRIKTNKDLFQSLDDPVALLDQLHIY